MIIIMTMIMIIIITLSTRFFHQSTKLLDSLPICLITIKIKKKLYLQLRYIFKLWRLNLDLKSVSKDAGLRSMGKLFHN